MLVAGNLYGGASTNPVTLTVTGSPPTISSQPNSVNVYIGQSINLTVTATGPGALSYQWKKNGSAISGATSAAFSIAASQLSDAGSYTVTVSNFGGTVTSNTAVVSVSPQIFISGGDGGRVKIVSLGGN